MEIEYLGSFTRHNLPPEKRPEICVMGRSNVGKSSFINTILGRRNIARTSTTPGKTRTINMFRLEAGFVLVDLPGFGYASVPRGERKRWAGDIEHYMRTRGSLKAAVLLVDARHFPMEADTEAIEWLRALGIPFLLVMTKVDKLKSSDLARLKTDMTGLSDAKGLESIRFSAKTGLGKKEVWHWITKTLGA